jgi:hypothetical protein
MCDMAEIMENPVLFDYYKDKAKCKYLILNYGESFPKYTISKFVKTALELKAHEIIAPCAAKNSIKTVSQVSALCAYINDNYQFGDFNITLMPQGRDMNDVLECVTKLARYPGYVIAISADTFPRINKYISERLRFSLLQKMAQTRMLGRKQVHLMELHGLQFLKAYHKGQNFFKIRSINTSFPVGIGLMGKTFEQTKKKIIMPMPETFGITDTTLRKIEYNIKYMKEYN